MDANVAALREHVRRGTLEHRRAYHREYMRKWRKKRPMTLEQQIKSVTRAYANVYFNRGKIERQPCKCGTQNTQMHHPDYAKPLLVEWLCRPCHLTLHKTQAISTGYRL